MFLKCASEYSWVCMSSPAQTFQGRPHAIAPAWHTCCVLAMLAVFSRLLAYLGLGSSTPKLGHLLLFSIVIAFEWTVFAFTLWNSSSTFVGYVARVVRNPRSLLLDIPAALLLVAVSFLVAPVVVRVLRHAGWASLEGMRPRNALEVVLWIVASLSAGICEETIFRGYLQQQFSAWIGHGSIGVFGQAVMFGLAHGYQGWKNMVLVFVLGCIFGAFVVLRKGLRANMIAHAGADILSAF